MEPVIEQQDAGLKRVVITRYPAIRAGIPIQFQGQEHVLDAAGALVLDANGDPIPASEFVDIELVVPPLDLDSMQEFEVPLKGLSEASPSQALQTLQAAIKRALRRNYRGVPDWLIRQSFDIGNIGDLSIALMDINGMRRKEIEAGKARAAAEAQRTGTPSTAASSPAPGTPGP